MISILNYMVLRLDVPGVKFHPLVITNWQDQQIYQLDGAAVQNKYPPHPPRNDIWKKIWKDEGEKIFYRPAFWKCCLRDSQSTGHVLSSNTNNFGVSNWNLFSKHPSSFVIARTSPLPPVNMTPSLLLAIFKWFPIVNLRWHKCHVSCHILIFPIEYCDISVSQPSQSQPTLATITTPGPLGHSSTNCDSLINTVTTDWRKCKSWQLGSFAQIYDKVIG